jgi:hypothetical protein
MESGPCTESDWGEFQEPLTGEEKTTAELQAMSLTELYTLTTNPPFGDVLQGPHPTIDGWVLPKSAVALMDASGVNANAVLIGANSFDGIFGGFDEMAPDSEAFYTDFMFGLLGLSGFSLSGTLAVMEQYTPERYLHKADGDPFYPASAAQVDGDMNVVCPSKWMHQRLGRLGKSARLYYFEYGPSCVDGARKYPGNPYTAAGGWASHGTELAFVFGNPSTAWKSDEVCDVSAEGASAARLATLIPQLWISFAKTGTPHAEPALFTVGGDAEDQWPACGPDATVGSSANEPMLVLGADTVGIVRGRKDEDCTLLHEHIKRTNSNLWPWFQGFFASAAVVGAAATAVKTQKLPSPLGQLPEKATCEGAARISLVVTLVVSLLAALLPWIAPHGAVPFVLAVCCASALLLRDPRVVCGTSALAFLVGLWFIELLVVFSNAADYKPDYFGDHNYSAHAAFWLSNLLVPLYVLMPCTLCFAAKGIHGQDKTALVPLVPMMPLGGDANSGGAPKQDDNYGVPP